MTTITLYNVYETLQTVDNLVNDLNNASDSERIDILQQIALEIGLGIIENSVGGKAAKYGDSILEAAKSKGIASDIIDSLENIVNDLGAGRKVNARKDSTANDWQRPRGWRLPVTKGQWEQNGTPGNTNWYSDKPAVNAVTGGQPVPFVKGYPDFSQWATETFPVHGMNGTGKDFSLIRKYIKDKYNLPNLESAGIWLKEHGLTPHHHQNGVDIQLVPSQLHNNIPHIGGAAMLRRMIKND